MAGSLGDRLKQLRQQQFIGRQGERDMVRSLFGTADDPVMLLYVYGPGGVGKTTLLREIIALAEGATMQVVHLDGRNIEPSPAAFLATLQNKLAVANPGEIHATLADSERRFLLAIDTAELLVPIDGWLRENFLPTLPPTVVVVIAGREPPDPLWRSDPGWREMMRLVPLKNLSIDESRAFLVQRQVPAREHQAILQFTHGHPLALSLVADVMAQQPDTRFRPEEMPDVVKTLLEQFLQEAPTITHRAALEAASQVRFMNEPLLKAMVEVDDPHPYFTWLRTLSFMDTDARGLFPHDLAREAVAADLRWRNPAWLAELHDRARGYFIAKFRIGTPREQRQILEDYVFLHRENVVIQPFFEWQSSGVVYTDQFYPADKIAILNMIEAHEGAAAQAVAAHWLEQPAATVIVLRTPDNEAQGVLFSIALEQTTPADRQIDPGCQAVWRYLSQLPPLRQGETATLFRFWLAKDTYQDVSPAQSRIFLNMVQHYLTTTGLAYTFLPCANAPFWRDMFAFADLHSLPDANFKVGEQNYGVYGHDWRAMPPLNWLALLAKRELGEVTPATSHLPQVDAEPVVVLDEAAFKGAVRAALRDLNSHTALESNPLLRCRFIQQHNKATASPADRAAALQSLIHQVIEPLQSSPRQLKLYRALYHTYMQAAPTQEKAAELLSLPFSTYRRHLRQGIAQVAAHLWALEIAPQM